VVADASGVSAARRAAGALSRAASFGETDAGRMAIVVTEAATNLLKHAGGGEILLEALCEGPARGVQMLALDCGRGMANVATAARDGYSTSGGPGTGLGAITRQSDVSEIASLPGKGTAVLAQVWPHRRVPTTAAVRVGGAGAPRAGENVSGDGWMVVRDGGKLALVIVDGLGHGPIAATARSEALRVFEHSGRSAPAEHVGQLHAALRSTRGAAVAVAEIDPGRRLLKFCGLGNIAAVILSGGAARHLVSHNGTAGHSARKIDEFAYPWPDDATLIAHSDGLISHWTLDGYPAAGSLHPSLVAGLLYRDFKRGRDDVTVVVARGGRR
jgi:anti-sigma regulatory factor (Ser/Thr protein kinase)